jgi:hypothetical protein
VRRWSGKGWWNRLKASSDCWRKRGFGGRKLIVTGVRWFAMLVDVD